MQIFRRQFDSASSLKNNLWGYSSVGRTCALQAWGHRFESVYLQKMKYLLLKDQRRRTLIANYEIRRKWLRALYNNLSLPYAFRNYIYSQLFILPRDSSITRLRNRCVLTNRPRGIYKKFGLSRLMFRKYIWQGKLVGFRKASW